MRSGAGFSVKSVVFWFWRVWGGRLKDEILKKKLCKPLCSNINANLSEAGMLLGFVLGFFSPSA